MRAGSRVQLINQLPPLLQVRNRPNWDDPIRGNTLIDYLILECINTVTYTVHNVIIFHLLMLYYIIGQWTWVMAHSGIIRKFVKEVENATIPLGVSRAVNLITAYLLKLFTHCNTLILCQLTSLWCHRDSLLLHHMIQIHCWHQQIIFITLWSHDHHMIQYMLTHSLQFSTALP